MCDSMSKNDRLEVHLWVIITVKLLVYLPLGTATFGFPLHAALFFHQETKGETHKYSGLPCVCGSIWTVIACGSREMLIISRLIDVANQTIE